MNKSKTVSNGDFITIRKDKKICRARKNCRMPNGIYFSGQKETRMDMDGNIEEVEIPEHIKLKGTVVLEVAG